MTTVQEIGLIIGLSLFVGGAIAYWVASYPLREE